MLGKNEGSITPVRPVYWAAASHRKSDRGQTDTYVDAEPNLRTETEQTDTAETRKRNTELAAKNVPVAHDQ